MLDKLSDIKSRFEEVETLLSQPQTISNRSEYVALSREHKELAGIVEAFDRYQSLSTELMATKEMYATEKDPDFRQMAKTEVEQLESQQKVLEEDLKAQLLPKDPNDVKDVVLEIRAGTGGDEAALFAGDLFRMYVRFAESKQWQVRLVEALEGVSGGYKEIVCTVSGKEVYGTLKYESGVHRVQRVPATETQGRVHTSAASVVVLPEVDEVDVKLDMNEIRKDTFCSSGPGGQSVNTTYSAVRLTHLPTGLVVSCQDGKSQLKNLDKALQVLRARLYERELKAQQEAIGAERRSMVKSGDRSEKIRTYNYPQGRVTDHRINYTTHNLPAVLDGDVGALIEALRIADRAEKLSVGEVERS